MRGLRTCGVMYLLAGLAACGGAKAASDAATSGTTPVTGTAPATAPGAAAPTATTVFPADALDVCGLLESWGLDKLLNAPTTTGSIHGPASKSRGSCEIRSESTHLRVAQFPLEELDDHVGRFKDAKPCEPTKGIDSWPERCSQTPTGGFFAAYDTATGLQIVSVKATGSGLKPMAGAVDAKGIIVVSGLETAKTQRSAGVLLGLL